MIYFLIDVQLLFVLIFNNLLEKKIRGKYFIEIIFAQIILITVIRYGMGTDYFTYLHLFENLESFNQFTLYPEFDKLFLFICLIFKYIAYNPVVAFNLLSLLSLIPAYYIIKKYSKDPVLSVAIFYNLYLLPYVFNGVSQGIAMFLPLPFIFYYLNKKKYLPILLIGTISFFINKLGILYVFFIPFSFIKFKKRFIILLIAIVLALSISGIFQDFFERFIFDQLPLILRLNINNYLRKYPDPIPLYSIALRLIWFIPIILVDIKDEFYIKLTRIYFISILIYILFSFLGLFIGRINLFFRVVDIILLPYVFTLVKPKFIRKALVLVYLVTLVLVLTSDFGKITYYPFRWIIEIFS